jgi:CheY-like chemotaxis protein
MALSQPCKRILIVDDERDTQEAVAEVLEDGDYIPTAAGNGREALEQLHAMVDKPCAILLDLKMPVMNGFEFRAAQRADPALERIPVIILTANFQEAEVTDMEAAAFVRKPFDADALLGIVKAACGRASALDGASWVQVTTDPERWERTGLGAVEARGPSLWAALPNCGHHYYASPDLAHAQRELENHWGLCFACWYRTRAFRRALKNGRTTPPDGTAFE